jgi:hypothetical protein
MKTILRDRNNRPIGSIERLRDDRIEGRDANGRLKGTYDTKSDTTRDSSGRPVGRGNLLAAVISSALMT